MHERVDTQSSEGRSADHSTLQAVLEFLLRCYLRSGSDVLCRHSDWMKEKGEEDGAIAQHDAPRRVLGRSSRQSAPRVFNQCAGESTSARPLSSIIDISMSATTRGHSKTHFVSEDMRVTNFPPPFIDGHLLKEPCISARYQPI